MAKTLRHLLLVIGAAAVGWFLFALPDPLFDDPTAMVLEDREGHLLSARIASDEQWRFPARDSVTYRFRESIINFEDRRFFSHFGVDPLAMARAMRQNIKERRVVSGGSTLSMQVIRLARKGKQRTIAEKIIECILAFRLELRYSKEEILSLYAAHAPFGGNVVGLEAASWRYFGRAPEQLSWSEAATLAVLPNNPALVHPGRNRDVLKGKRDRVLSSLYESAVIDSLSAHLAMLEPLPEAPKPLPDDAPHLLNRLQTEEQGQQRVRTTLEKNLQKSAQDIVDRHRDRLEGNGIHNAAALIIDNRTGQVQAYIGNVSANNLQKHGRSVDIITAPRSTGSILKPFLYAAMLDDGQLLPRTLVADIPTRFGGFAPVNFNQRFEGALPADEALARSLNVPTVRMLRDYSVPRFHHLLKNLGMTTLTQPPSHYGLSIILGGSEGTLWDIASMYAGMAHEVRSSINQGLTSWQSPRLIAEQSAEMPVVHALSTPAIWLTFEALSQVKRPEAEGLWEYFSSSRKVAWKTGTSFGFRDAWAVGVTPQYTVAVWAGNADGEGRPNLTGVTAAAPILFDLFDILDIQDTWFAQPMHRMEHIQVCAHSGHRAGAYCPRKDMAWVTKAGLRTPPCPYHKEIHLDPKSGKRVNGACASPLEMQRASWFVLPPAMEWFYKSKQGSYKPLPAYREDCREAGQLASAMEFIYPRNKMTIHVPVELDGSMGAAVLEVAHRSPDKRIHWHLDDEYLGTTSHFHQLQVRPTEGEHKLVVVDEDGQRVEQVFRVAVSR